jgi:hypothetical protein
MGRIYERAINVLGKFQAEWVFGFHIQDFAISNTDFLGSGTGSFFKNSSGAPFTKIM